MSGAIVLVLILLIAFAGAIANEVLKRTSHLLVEEFMEMEEIQNLRFSINQLNNCFQRTLESGNNGVNDGLDSFVAEATASVEKTRKTLTDRHNPTILDELTKTIGRIGTESEPSTLVGPHLKPVLKVGIHKNQNIAKDLNKHVEDLDVILLETKTEVDKYVRLNQKAIAHGRVTIMTLIILVFLVILFGGMVFIRSLTRPITQLLESIEDVTLGNFKVVAQIPGQDEFGTLAKAFNTMVARIDEVTVTRDQFDNIFNSIHDGLIVTDLEGRVTATNLSAAAILELGKDSGSGIDIRTWFINGWSPPLKSSGHKSVESETVVVASTGKKVPVLFAISMLKDLSGSLTGCVTGFHDLTERKKIEQEVLAAQNEKAVAIFDAQEQERFRLAQELHDGIGQILTFANYALESLGDKIPDQIIDMKQDIHLIKNQITGAISESRKISHNLIPLALHHFGLEIAIRELVGNLNHQTNTRFHFQTYGSDCRLNLQLELLLFRSCQELLQNVMKHAHAGNAFIQLIHRDARVVLICEDDGQGFSVQKSWQPDQGIGLATIKERVEAFNGQVIVHSGINRGTEITLELPLNFQRNE